MLCFSTKYIVENMSHVFCVTFFDDSKIQFMKRRRKAEPDLNTKKRFNKRKKQMQKVFLIKIQKSNERINSFLVTKRLFLFRFVFKVSQLWWQTSSFKFSFSSPKFSFLFGLASPRPNDRRRRI
jgi:hypothetical protein